MQKEIEFIESKINKDTILIVASFMIAVIGLMMPLDNDLTLRVGAFLLVSGSLFAGIKMYFLIQHERIKNKFYEHTIEVSQVHNGLRATVADEARNAEPIHREHIVYLDKVNDDGQHETDLRRFDPANKPPKEFIIACFGLAIANENRRVTERSVINELLPKRKDEQDKWDKWNVWLDEMEKVGILVPEDNRPHSARYWDVAKFQMDTALEVFEYEPIPSPAQYQRPSELDKRT